MNSPEKAPLSPTSLPKKKSPPIASFITIATMLIIVIVLWRDLSRTKETHSGLAEKNADLQAALTAARTELNTFKTGDSSAGKKEGREEVRVKPKPVEEPETLLLQNPSVNPSATGLVVRLAFQSTLPDAPELIALVVRLPNTSTSTIQGFNAADPSAFNNIKARVDGDGKFAIFKGSPTHLNALEFDLKVSEPVTATVRGTKGVKAFEIDISAETPQVRKL